MPGTSKSTKALKQADLGKFVTVSRRNRTKFKRSTKGKLDTTETPENTTPLEQSKKKKPRHRKKRTPPSPTSEPEKKKSNLQPKKLDMDPTTNTMDTTEPYHKESESEEDEVTIELDEDARKLQIAITQAINKKFKEQLKKRLDPIERDVGALLSLKNCIEQQRSEISTIKAENIQLKDLCKKMVQEHDELKRRVSNLEDMKLVGNVIFHGIPETKWEKDNETLSKVYNMMAELAEGDTKNDKLEQAKKVKILSVRRLGRPIESRTRPIQVKYENENDVIELLNNKRKLPKGIYADKEYTAETEKRRRILRPILKAAKNIPEYKKKSKLDGDTLVIKSQRYTITDLHKLPTKLSGFNVTSTSNDDSLAFFGELNAFSNFHPCTFVIDGTSYNCSEQYIQHRKALFFGDNDSANRILNASTGLECKRLSKDIDNYEHADWKEVAKYQCLKGITEKFVQNPTLLGTLLNTGTKVLVEGSRDSLWGTGVDLHSDDVLNRDKWKNTGILGEILMYIRDNHQPDPTSANVPLEHQTSATATTS